MDIGNLIKPAIAVPALVALLAVAGCSADEPGGSAGVGAAKPDAGASGVAAVDEPAVLHLDGGGTTDACMSASAVRDLAYFDVAWKSDADLETLTLRLTNPVGVKQVVADTLNVPPRNFGGRIDLGGSASWKGRAKALDNPALMWPQADELWTWSPAEGESGLGVLHIRIDDKAIRTPEGASFDGVTATYRTMSGDAGSVSIKTPNTFRAQGHGC